MCKEEALDDLPPKDERGPASVRRTMELFQRRDNVGEASERRDRSHMGFSERIDTIVVIVVFDKSNIEWPIFDKKIVFDVCVCMFCCIYLGMA